MHFTTFVSSFLFASVVYSLPQKLVPTITAGHALCNPTGASAPQATVASFIKYGVIPTLIPSLQPKVDVHVTYDKAVNLGNEFTTTETLNKPIAEISGILYSNTATTQYSLFMIDPDVPNPGPGHQPYLHWYVAHVKSGCAVTQQNETVVAYESPSPGNPSLPTLPNDGEHTYTFLAYLEPAGFQPNPLDPTLQARVGFDVNTYAAENGLQLVGGNFFLEDLSNT